MVIEYSVLHRVGAGNNFKYLFDLFIYYLFILAVPDLICGAWDLRGLFFSFWLQQVDFLAVACGLLICDMQTLSCGMHVRSSSPTTD